MRPGLDILESFGYEFIYLWVDLWAEEDTFGIGSWVTPTLSWGREVGKQDRRQSGSLADRCLVQARDQLGWCCWPVGPADSWERPLGSMT